jgi:hypothetical protein
VALYIEGFNEPLVAITNTFGDFALVNIPVRPRGLTCGWEKITASGYGDFLLKGDEWVHGASVQSPTLTRRPQTEYGGSVAGGQPCLKWRPPSRQLGGLS